MTNSLPFYPLILYPWLLIMSPLSLPTQTLTWLTHAEQAGQRDAQVLLHLLNRADANDQDVAKFLDSYSKNSAALCRRLEVLERTAGLRHPTPPAPADDDLVADVLTKAETVLTRVGDEGFDMHDLDEATKVLAAIRLVMRQHGIRTSDLSPAPPPPPAAPVPPAASPAEGLVESVARIIASDSSEGLESFQGISKDVIYGVAAWLDIRRQHGCSALLREEIDR